MSFELLKDNEKDPIGGLFFFQSQENEIIEKIQSGDHEIATGIGFLIDKEGIVATCAHVIVAAGQGKVGPGGRITIHSAAVPVSLEATVIPSKWIGPAFQENKFQESNYWRNYSDDQPQIFKQDLALLRLDIATARWHVNRTKNGQQIPST